MASIGAPRRSVSHGARRTINPLSNYRNQAAIVVPRARHISSTPTPLPTNFIDVPPPITAETTEAATGAVDTVTNAVIPALQYGDFCCSRTGLLSHPCGLDSLVVRPHQRQHRHELVLDNRRRDCPLARAVERSCVPYSPASDPQSIAPTGAPLGLFFGVRKMCEQVVQLQHSGVSWLPDLTATDPTYILPALLAAAIHLQIKLGAANVDAATTPNLAHGLNFLRLAIIRGIWIMSGWPSGLLVSLLTTSTLASAESAILRKPMFHPGKLWAVWEDHRDFHRMAWGQSMSTMNGLRDGRRKKEEVWSEHDEAKEAIARWQAAKMRSQRLKKGDVQNEMPKGKKNLKRKGN
ncbi:hypothetical protein D9619_009105 [Psilocybe cf. subviscida]|uniref:Uncharacterized protein n=1 Tax=Psilocybe cf. subviscida TaxID=2480587 RepID=A0A8H5FA84_9AGAR|nr:hypothetical protein D9619_009105 [Psilocybe cf. subviscida]